MPILPVTNVPQGQHYSDSHSSPFAHGPSSGPTIGIPGQHAASGSYGYGQTGPAARAAAASSAGYYDPGRRRKSNDGMGGGPFSGFGGSSGVRHGGTRRGSFSGSGGGGGGGSSSLLGYVPLFLRRLFRFPHMDFQLSQHPLPQT
ncbi:hypothetical protein DFQ27_008858 [Actinomortierella ambigua]|uniref:Uncharacterized protein n=1 Tax=Actinomortierella ambigua TaxID=1343610 RepID=A0A9P6PRH0_9FUNG|nr:hypothetical protein DFQ27_008858 [Actinomortierella ambigua]